MEDDRDCYCCYGIEVLDNQLLVAMVFEHLEVLVLQVHLYRHWAEKYVEVHILEL